MSSKIRSTSMILGSLLFDILSPVCNRSIPYQGRERSFRLPYSRENFIDEGELGLPQVLALEIKSQIFAHFFKSLFQQITASSEHPAERWTLGEVIKKARWMRGNRSVVCVLTWNSKRTLSRFGASSPPVYFAPHMWRHRYLARLTVAFCARTARRKF